ncbi:MAG: hypothetical protein GTO03_02785, partial [Planctomycetales bacterium]|nr:hypothetical protein [Planctomycetales bacterium]
QAIHDLTVGGALGSQTVLLMGDDALPGRLDVGHGMVNRGNIQLNSFDAEMPAYLNVLGGRLSNRGVIDVLGARPGEPSTGDGRRGITADLVNLGEVNVESDLHFSGTLTNQGVVNI